MTEEAGAKKRKSREEMFHLKKREIYGVYLSEGISEAIKHGRRCGIMKSAVYKICQSDDGVFVSPVYQGKSLNGMKHAKQLF